jgi:RNA polymerase sigma-70 factor (sigma-E family)
VSFDAFVAARLHYLLRYAGVLTCDPHLAEDIVQEVFLRLQSRWHRVGGMEQPEAYVKRMILNEMLGWRRRRWARVVLLRGPVLEQAAGATPDGTRDVDDREVLLGLIAALPPRQRAVLVLRFYEGKSDTEIADLLGCSEAAVRSNSSRAVAALRAAIDPHHLESSR